MRRLASLFILPGLLAASEPAPKPADIDRLWALRAEGSTGGRALSGPIDLAIDACRAALAAEPDSLEARWRLMRALYFKGEHTTGAPDAKRTIFDEGRTVAEQALAILRREAGREKPQDLSGATPVELVPYVKGNAAAVPSLLWARPWYSPASIAVNPTPPVPLTGTGVSRFAVDPSPTWPE